MTASRVIHGGERTTNYYWRESMYNLPGRRNGLFRLSKRLEQHEDTLDALGARLQVAVIVFVVPHEPVVEPLSSVHKATHSQNHARLTVYARVHRKVGALLWRLDA